MYLKQFEKGNININNYTHKKGLFYLFINNYLFTNTAVHVSIIFWFSFSNGSFCLNNNNNKMNNNNFWLDCSMHLSKEKSKRKVFFLYILWSLVNVSPIFGRFQTGPWCYPLPAADINYIHWIIKISMFLLDSVPLFSCFQHNLNDDFEIETRDILSSFSILSFFF